MHQTRLTDEIRLAIVGSRRFMDYIRFTNALETWIERFDRPTMVVSGGADGADKMAERWADENGIPKKVFDAHWDIYGNDAGMMRNAEIVNMATHMIAFWRPGSRGTENSMKKARDKKIPLEIVMVGNLPR